MCKAMKFYPSEMVENKKGKCHKYNPEDSRTVDSGNSVKQGKVWSDWK